MTREWRRKSASYQWEQKLEMHFSSSSAVTAFHGIEDKASCIVNRLQTDRQTDSRSFCIQVCSLRSSCGWFCSLQGLALHKVCCHGCLFTNFCFHANKIIILHFGTMVSDCFQVCVGLLLLCQSLMLQKLCTFQRLFVLPLCSSNQSLYGSSSSYFYSCRQKERTNLGIKFCCW